MNKATLHKNSLSKTKPSKKLSKTKPCKKLSKEQIDTFNQSGYLHIPNAINAALLQYLQQESDLLLKQIYQQLKSGTIHPDHAFTCRLFQSYLNRINNFHLHASPKTLALLGHHLIQDIANKLCHQEHIVSVDMMIIKNLGDELTIPWHQDITFNQNKDKIIAVGVYLEPSKLDDAPLTLIRDSHSKVHKNIEQYAKLNQNKRVSICAKAGDIIVHNPMLVHSSNPINQQSIRRTIYYEFRSLSHVRHSWSDNNIRKRQLLEYQAIKQNQQSWGDFQRALENFCR